jgi:uncharacterized damage-inducible protein DinB
VEAFFAQYVNELEGLHNEIKQALLGMPEPALDWSPGEGMNSITVLVVHTTGSQRYWIGDVAVGDPSARNRQAEFQTRDLGASALISRLDEAVLYAKDVLSRFTLDDLGQERLVPHSGAKVSMAEALHHSLTHTALHLGHIQITRQL